MCREAGCVLLVGLGRVRVPVTVRGQSSNQQLAARTTARALVKRRTRCETLERCFVLLWRCGASNACPGQILRQAHGRKLAGVEVFQRDILQQTERLAVV